MFSVYMNRRLTGFTSLKSVVLKRDWKIVKILTFSLKKDAFNPLEEFIQALLPSLLSRVVGFALTQWGGRARGLGERGGALGLEAQVESPS